MLEGVKSRTGKTPILIVDQIEDLLRGAAPGPARARFGALLAATVRQRPMPPCRWLLSYREEYHGAVIAWLRDVLAEARAMRLAGIDRLPHDLTAPDRFHARSLAPLGVPLPGADPISEASWGFLAEIQAPLAATREDGSPRYPWRFATGSAERLARAFAEARVARPEAPLTPELQVVLAHLLAGASGDVAEDGRWRAQATIEVPEDCHGLIDSALEDHLRRALETAFPGGRTGARQRRARALLALRELATATGQREDGLPAKELPRAIGEDGQRVLEQLATPLTRLIVAQEAPDSLRYRLSHDRMAEVVVRMVEAEGQGGQLVIDAELLRLRRFVAIETALHQSAEKPATRLPRRHFRRIETHAEALLWDDARRSWWAACRLRRRGERRRRAGRALAGAALLALMALAVWSWAATRAQRQVLRDQVSRGEPQAALRALEQLRRSGAGKEDLLALLRQREAPGSVLERGLGGLPEVERNAAVLAAAELMLPLVEEAPQDDGDPVLIASLVWGLDVAPMRDPRLQAPAMELRDRVLAPLRQLRRPPAVPCRGDPNWIEIQGGRFLMGTPEPDAVRADERPQHQVSVSSFRLQRHEVTHRQYRRLAPDHPGEADLPAGSVNWYEAYTYAAWLGGRLPTEAEWEYAARAGCVFAYCDAEGRETAIDTVAWTRRSGDNAEGRPAPRAVMLLGPNPWGLHDMLGNVEEWTADWYGGYPAAPQRDPPGAVGPAASGGGRVVRGGSYLGEPDRARAAFRNAAAPTTAEVERGLRVVLPAWVCGDSAVDERSS